MNLSRAAVAGFCLVGLCIATSTKGQDSRVAFDVVSVKPNNSGISASNTAFPPGGFKATNVWLKLMIRVAYGLPAYQITGGDDWTSSLMRFDIDAKSDGHPSHDEVLQMLQALLADRFKLRFHQMTKDDAIYTLSLAKGGPKFKAVPDNGTGLHSVEASQGKIIAKNGEMSRFVWFMTQILDRKVVDRTGLTGFYDFVFAQPSRVLPSPDSSEPTTFDALQDQLGLKLEPGKGSVEFFVIDHAEKPSPN